MEAHSRNTFEVINSTTDRRDGQLKNSPMSPNRSIALNIIATYGRSLYALVIGMF